MDRRGVRGAVRGVRVRRAQHGVQLEPDGLRGARRRAAGARDPRARAVGRRSSAAADWEAYLRKRVGFVLKGLEPDGGKAGYECMLVYLYTTTYSLI